MAIATPIPKHQPRSEPPGLIALQRSIYKRVRQSSYPTAELFGSFLDRRNLDAAWARVCRSPGASTPGTDGITCNDLLDHSDRWLGQLHRDLRTGRYRPQKPRWIDVPKQSGKPGTRRLGILTIRDRVVHAAVKQILEPVVDHSFLPISFGFRPGRSVASALLSAADTMQSRTAGKIPVTHAAHLDIRDCFGTIDHSILDRTLREFVNDEDLLSLIEVLLQSGCESGRSFWRRRSTGIVQGSALSPLLCNLYLHQLDCILTGYDRSISDCLLFRYADDLFVAGSSRSGVAGFVAYAARHARRLRLSLGSVHGVKPLSDGVDWLGVDLYARKSGIDGTMSYGYLVPDSRVGRILDSIREMTQVPSDRISRDAFNAPRWIVSMNDQLRQWWSTYRFADNSAEVFSRIDEYSRSRVRELLRELTGVPWSRLNRDFRRRLPRGFWTWEIDGCRLTCLSSLAPHSPDRLVRRPEWERDARRKNSFEAD